jgi:hypothetical protein
MSDYGDNYSMCNNDEQREAYQIGWKDAKADAGSQHPEHVGMLWREFYQFGFNDGAGG